MITACHCGTNGGVSGTCQSVPNACSPGPNACADHFSCEALTPDAAYAEGVPVDGGCHVCAFTPRGCQQNGDCCPGQVCNSSLGLCFDCYNVANGACGQSDCLTDAQCVTAQGPGHVCAPFGFDGGPAIQGEPASQRCTYPTCASTADCATGAACYLGYCVLTPPCNGACAAGTACAITDDLCSAVPPASASCQQSCGAGAQLVFVDESVPTGVYDACNLPKVACRCQTFPPITSPEIGEWSALAQDAHDVWVSAYDHAFGDLVAYHFATDGGLLALDYIDGLPDGGRLIGDPRGPRGGLAAPGPNVGEYTSIALSADGTPRIAYYDVDRAALKYAERLGDGGWISHTVAIQGDAGYRDFGRGTSIAIGENGAPEISFLELDGPDGGGSALDLAVATTVAPRSESDWLIVQIASTPGPCGGACAPGQACVDDSQPGDAGCVTAPNGTCQTIATGCASCATTEACIAVGDGGACAPLIGATATGGIPIGLGLESSLAVVGNVTVVAYADSLHGALMLAQQNGTTFEFQLTALDGRDPVTCANTGSVGRFPSLRIAPTGALAIAYQDETRGQLLYWTSTLAAPLDAQQRIVLDDGQLQPPDAGQDRPQVVGANASLAYGASGTAYVAYQDQTLLSQRLVSVPPSCTTANPSPCTPVLLHEWSGAAQGFFSSLGIVGGQAFISNASLTAGPAAGEGQLLLEGPLTLP